VALAVEVLESRVQPSTGPVGIFCSAGPTTGVGQGSVTRAVAQKDFVSGILVRIGWNLVEPADGQFSWGLLDEQVQRAAGYGKQVTLAVTNSGHAPSWLYDDGAQSFSYLYQGTPTQMPVPWDPIFLSKWTELIRQFGARYDGNPTVALVHITNATANGFEMQLPSTPVDVANWNAIGYTPQLVINSWTQVVDAFAASFPNTPLDVELHPVLQSDEVPNAVMNYAWNTYGTQFGSFAAWWSQHNTTVYPGPWQLLQQGVVQSFSDVQFVTNATNNPDLFGAGGFQAAIDLAFDTGIRYMEPWQVDILNPAFDTMFRDLANRLSGGPTAGGGGGSGGLQQVVSQLTPTVAPTGQATPVQTQAKTTAATPASATDLSVTGLLRLPAQGLDQDPGAASAAAHDASPARTLPNGGPDGQDLFAGLYL
jgi:hypothetical protein